MQIELRCPCCPSRFGAAPHLPAEAVRGRMSAAGTPYALEEGPTFQDMIFATLVQQGYVACPGCGGVVSIREVGAGAAVTPPHRHRPGEASASPGPRSTRRIASDKGVASPR